MKNKYISVLILYFYFVFLTLDLFGTYREWVSTALKFSCIVLCFINTLLIHNEHSKIDSVLLKCVFFMTIIADLNLLILNNYKLGVILFCIIQTFYIIRHSLASKFNYKIWGLFCIVFIIGVFQFKNILLLSGFYYLCLSILSIYTAISTLWYKKYPEITKRLIISGLILLFLCDINVALFNLKRNMISGCLIWFFYVPSQLFLSLSGEAKLFLPPKHRSQLKQQCEE